MKVLIVCEYRATALQYYRQHIPHACLQDNYDVKVTEVNNGQQKDTSEYIHGIDKMTDEQLKEFQIVHFLRLVSPTDRTLPILERCRKLGLKIVFDIDDHWELPKYHSQYQNYKTQRIGDKTIEALKFADLVTTTTNHFASKLREFNKNVEVLQNAIDPRQEQYQSFKTQSPRTRFGWVGGVYHANDLLLLKESIKKIYHKYYNDIQICLGGFNPNEHYQIYENILTDHWSVFNSDKEYLTYLKKLTPEGDHVSIDKPYRRLWGTDVSNFAYIYNYIDVCYVPLQPSLFSSCKSELKVIEAGFMKKAVIVSNVTPYKEVVDSSNALLVTTNDWYTQTRKVMENKELIEDLGEALHDRVKDEYHIKTPTEKRYQLYKNLCK